MASWTKLRSEGGQRLPFEYVASRQAASSVKHALDVAEGPGAPAQALTEGVKPFRIAFVNTAWSLLTGFTREECLGQTYAIMNGEQGGPSVSSCVEAAAAEGREALVRITNQKKGGVPYACLLALAPLVDESGRITHYLGTLHDLANPSPSGIQPEEVKWAACRLAAEALASRGYEELGLLDVLHEVVPLLPQAKAASLVVLVKLMLDGQLHLPEQAFQDALADLLGTDSQVLAYTMACRAHYGTACWATLGQGETQEDELNLSFLDFVGVDELR